MATISKSEAITNILLQLIGINKFTVKYTLEVAGFENLYNPVDPMLEIYRTLAAQFGNYYHPVPLDSDGRRDGMLVAECMARQILFPFFADDSTPSSPLPSAVSFSKLSLSTAKQLTGLFAQGGLFGSTAASGFATTLSSILAPLASGFSIAIIPASIALSIGAKKQAQVQAQNNVEFAVKNAINQVWFQLDDAVASGQIPVDQAGLALDSMAQQAEVPLKSVNFSPTGPFIGGMEHINMLTALRKMLYAQAVPATASVLAAPTTATGSKAGLGIAAAAAVAAAAF